MLTTEGLTPRTVVPMQPGGRVPRTRLNTATFPRQLCNEEKDTLNLEMVFSPGEQVLFWSKALSVWMPAEVMCVTNGSIEVSVKRGQLLSAEVQKERIKKLSATAQVTADALRVSLISQAQGGLRKIFRAYDDDAMTILSELEYLLAPIAPVHQRDLFLRLRVTPVDLDTIWNALCSLIEQSPLEAVQWLESADVQRRLQDRHATILIRPEAIHGQYPLPQPETCTEVNSLEEAFKAFCMHLECSNIRNIFSDIIRFLPMAEGEDPVAWLVKLLHAVDKPQVLYNKIFRPEYTEKVLAGKKAIVVGAGPCGLRMALELRLFGAQVDIMESRTGFTRMNVLKLWDFMGLDLLELGARELLPRFLRYRDHIGIGELQALLLKVCLLLGVSLHWGEAGTASSVKWNPHPPHMVQTAQGKEWPCDLLICATGNSTFAQNVGLPHIHQHDAPQETRVAVVANFLNAGQKHDKAIDEHAARLRAGVLSPQELVKIEHRLHQLGINKHFVYLQGETHYFIISPEVEDLSRYGIFHSPSLPIKPPSQEQMGLLDKRNVNMEALERWCRNAAASFIENDTGVARVHANNFFSKRPVVEESPGKPALAIFTFHQPTLKALAAMKFANGCPFFLVGDALQEPYWPEGEGIGKGFLGVMDTAYVVYLWASRLPDDAIVECRQTLFQQSANAPQGLLDHMLRPEEGGAQEWTSANYKYNFDPKSRYASCIDWPSAISRQANQRKRTRFELDSTISRPCEDRSNSRSRSPRRPSRSRSPRRSRSRSVHQHRSGRAGKIPLGRS